jgi:hypothetical protein
MVKVKTVITDSDQNPNIENPTVTRTVYYRRGTMRRVDSLGARTTPSVEQIANCETKVGYLVDLDTRQYRNYKVVRFASEEQRSEYLKKAGKVAIPVESKTVDTGERRVFFGYSAKHFITTTKRVNGNGVDVETLEGWYIDHEGWDRDCAPDFVRSEPYYLVGTAFVDYPDVAQIRHTGPLPMGLAVSLKLTDTRAAARDGSKKHTITVEKTVEELSDAPLNPSLFELTSGFHENPELFRGHDTPDR